MDKAQAREMGDAVRIAVEEVAKRFNMDVVVKGGRYDPVAGTFSPRIEFTSADSGRVNFERDAYALGVSADLYGKTFTHQNKEFTVLALNLRAPKYPLQATGTDGRVYKFTDAVLERIQKENA